MIQDSWKCCTLLYSLYKLFYSETNEHIEAVRRSAQSCGPFGQKLLQFIMMHDGFLSSESKKKFGYIFEHCSTHSWEDTQEMYYQDFDRDIEEDFEIRGTDIIPIGSGTIGQVYKLFHRKLNKYIALKVRHPKIEEDSRRFVYTIQTLLYMTEWVKNIPFSILIREFLNNIHIQMDYRLETENTKQMRKNFMDDSHIIIPKIYYYNTRFIAMSFHEGVSFPKIKDAALRIKVSSDLLLFNTASLLVYDYLHCDLHYGNWKVLVLPDGEYKLIIYDCGIIGSTGDEEINKKVLLSSLDGDYTSTYKMLVPDMIEQKNGAAMLAYTETLMNTYYEKSSDRFSDFLKQLFLYKIHFNLDILRCIQGLLTCLSVLSIVADRLTKFLGTAGNRKEILVCYYHGILQKLQKYHVLATYLETWMEEDPMIETVFYEWLEETFGHRDKGVFIDATIHYLLSTCEISS